MAVDPLTGLGNSVYRLDGILSVNGVTGPQTFWVTFFGTEPFPGG